jgi:hypothetical protein
VVYIGCTDFLLELPVVASDVFFARLTLHHTSESAPIWVHASTEELELHLWGMLQRGQADACSASLANLRDAQETLRRSADSSPTRRSSAWLDARAALVAACGGCEPVCDGLRGLLYSPSRHLPGAAMAACARHVMLAAADTSVSAGEPSRAPWSLRLEPAMTMPRSHATSLFTAAGFSAEAAVALSDSAAPSLAASAQPSVAVIHTGSSARSRLMDVVVSHNNGLACSRRVDVPTDRRIHRQQWVLHPDSEFYLDFNELPIADISALPAVLQQLRQHACFSALCATAASETFPSTRTFHLGVKRRRSGNRSNSSIPAAEIKYGGQEEASRVELQQRPPSALSLLFTVAAPPPFAGLSLPGHTAAESLVELQLTMGASDEVGGEAGVKGCAGAGRGARKAEGAGVGNGCAGAEGEGFFSSAVAALGVRYSWSARFRSTNDEVLAGLSGTYAARLVNECQSLPLLVAFLDQHARVVATGGAREREEAA